MHIGKGYSFKEVILWTFRDILQLSIISTIPTVLYLIFHWRWLTFPWLPIALLGTAVAFVIGFKNNASYDRVWEARKIWGAITNASRSWGIMVKDYVTNQHAKNPVSEAALKDLHLTLFKRHLAWVTALRYQLRENKSWEAINLPHNREYRDRWFKVEEQETNLAEVLKPYLPAEEYDLIMSKSNKAAQLLALQSEHLRKLLEQGFIEDFRHMELERLLVEFYNQQGASERIKNFPYPRQYASLNMWFIKIFIFLLPFGMLQEFEKIGSEYIWLTIPFSVLSGWVFTTMERIGETSENPFEGSANDVPITTISRNIEIDMLEMLHIAHALKPTAAQNNILT
ncbi:MAG: multidrug transporter [Cytophagales bacterium]|nr:MAG: multidrug transporter [Cytophagales bacterium]